MSSHHARVPVPGTAAPAPGAPQAAAPAAPEALRPAAATLTVGAADDRAEHAADALADRALARLDGADPHRHTPGCGHLRRSVDAGATGVVGLAGGALDADVTSRVDAARSGGTGLPGPVRRRMESAFGTDLGHVRVHTGPEAGQLSRAMSAEAFTTGDDIFFGSGRFAPHDPVGEKVLAHEIAHVVQETGSRAVRRWSNPFTKLFGGSSKPAAAPAAPAAAGAAAAPAGPSAEEVKATVEGGEAAEKAELAALAEARVKGERGRARLSELVHGDDGIASITPGARMDSLWDRFDQALAFELQTYGELMKAEGADAEQAARQAYEATWFGRFGDLESVAPQRRTAAERLLRQVGAARDAAGRNDVVVAAENEAVATMTMLPTEVEDVYDRMVVAMRQVQAESDEKKDGKKDEKQKTRLHVEVARNEASKRVRASLTPKLAGKLPVRNSVVDREAWARAEQRAPQRDARRARQAAGLEANLADLTELDKLDGKVASAASVGGAGLSAAGAAGGAIAGLHTPKVKKAPGGSDLPGGGGPVDAVSRAAWRKDNDVRSDDAYDKLGGDPLASDGGKAKEGISTVTGILGGLLTAVREALAAARATRDAWGTKEPYGSMKATKAAASSVNGLVSSAKSTANLAKLIDPGVASGVAKVVPGLDIAAAALSMVKAVTDVAVAGMRQHETDTAMFSARAARTGKEVDVMVWPLMNLSRQYTKNLENTTWALGSSVADLGLSIGQVASAGGFGIPAAIKAVKAVVDNVHSLGHFIADQVFVVQAQTAERESKVQHLEGGAEDELRRHPKAAVDGIILRAAAGDETAKKFLANYRVNGKPVDDTMLRRIKPVAVVPHDPSRQRADATTAQDVANQPMTTDDGALVAIRQAVLAAMGVDADPLTVFQNARAAFTSAAATVASLRAPGTTPGGLSDRWRRTEQLAGDRNAVQAGAEANGGKARNDRGLFWRITQTLKGEEHLARKERLTSVLRAQGTGAPSGTLVVGTVALAVDATPPQFAAFVDALSIADIEAELAARPQRNSPEMVDVLLELLQRKVTEAAAAKK